MRELRQAEEVARLVWLAGVLEVYHTWPLITTREAARPLGCSRIAVQRALAQLEAGGASRRIGERVVVRVNPKVWLRLVLADQRWREQ